MSTMIMSACWPLQGMSLAQKATLISLADNANDQGVCWPSIPTIAKRICASERAVQNAIKWLELAGIVTANRNNGRHTSYMLTPAAYSPPQDIHPRTKCAGAGDSPAQEMHHTPAPDSPHPSTAFTTPPHQVPSNRKEPPREPSLNRQPARRAPRVALHREILNIELPDTIPFELWDMWCAFREAKSHDKAAPWIMPTAKVSISRIQKLLAAGQSVETTIEEAVLRGWTGLFPVKASSLPATPGSPQAVDESWWRNGQESVKARGNALDVPPQRDKEVFLQYQARVFKAAGPGPWMEDMLAKTARESEERYNALFAYFNDVRVERAAA